VNDYFRRLEDQLAALTEAGAHLDRGLPRRAGPRRALGAVLPAVAIGIAVAVAAVLLLSVSSRNPRPSSPLGNGASVPAGQHYSVAGVTLKQLLDNFAVLRRAQTPQDRSWTPQCDCGGSAIQENKLTRLAQTLPHGYRVFFDVEQFTTGRQEGMPAGSDVMNLDIVGPTGNTTSSFFGANVQYMIDPLAFGGLLRGPQQKTSVLAGIVPDGVGSVTWTIGCRAQRISTCSGPPHTYTVPVVNNVAALELSPSCGRCNAEQIIWRAPQTGRIVASFGGFGNLAAPPFVKGGFGPRTLQALLPDGIGAARFGQPAADAIEHIDQLLGPAAATNINARSCGISHESVWSSPAAATPLTIFEHAGRFVGYEYGSAANRLDLRQGPGAVLTTERGLTLADKIGNAKTLYAHLLKTSTAHGGSWHIVGSSLGGYVTPTIYPLRRVTSANPIATIGAGDTGCAPRSTRFN
jgi:hypothetical protein